MDNQKESQTDDTVLDAYPMPDPSVSPTALEALDCPRKDLLPLWPDRACELLEDMTVYAALPAGELEMPLTVEEIRQYPPDTVFAVPKREWEKGADFRTAVSSRMDRQDEREDAFLRHSGDCFAIYQFRAGAASSEPVCRTLEDARVQGLSPRNYSYELVYTAPLPEGVGLEELHTRFTGRLLRDFLFREIKPCDIIAVRENGVLTPWYVDTLSYSRLDGLFQNLPAFQHTQEGRMTGEELNKALYDKMEAELKRYGEWLTSQPPDEILRNAYEYAIRQDIVLYLQDNDLDDEQAQALLDMESPLYNTFNRFEKQNTGHMHFVRMSLEILANEQIHLKREQARELRETPISKTSLRKAGTRRKQRPER